MMDERKTREVRFFPLVASAMPRCNQGGSKGLPSFSQLYYFIRLDGHNALKRAPFGIPGTRNAGRSGSSSFSWGSSVRENMTSPR